MTLQANTEQIIDNIAQKECDVILFCSLGKDSLVTLDLIAPKFRRVVCVFMYFVKGLEHCEKYIRWIKARYSNVEIMQVPHWNLSYLLRAGLYCVPNPSIKTMKLKDVVKSVRLQTGIYHCFFGMKKADGMNRRLMLNTYAAHGYENNGFVYPLAEWTQNEILAYMRQNKLPQPVRYSLKASSGVGFGLDCLLWLRNNYPEDLQRIYTAFPLCERVLFEYDNEQKNEAETTP